MGYPLRNTQKRPKTSRIYPIFSHLQKHPDESRVYLDLRVIEPDRVRYRFPNIIRKCQKWAGIDVFKTPIPVTPAAHYWMGGITTDLTSQTSIPRLIGRCIP